MRNDEAPCRLESFVSFRCQRGKALPQMEGFRPNLKGHGNASFLSAAGDNLAVGAASVQRAGLQEHGRQTGQFRPDGRRERIIRQGEPAKISLNHALAPGCGLDER
jgi:uncharacterized protein YcbX